MGSFTTNTVNSRQCFRFGYYAQNVYELSFIYFVSHVPFSILLLQKGKESALDELNRDQEKKFLDCIAGIFIHTLSIYLKLTNQFTITYLRRLRLFTFQSDNLKAFMRLMVLDWFVCLLLMLGCVYYFAFRGTLANLLF